jgi:U-box domain
MLPQFDDTTSHESIPPEFICPITLQLMDFPMVSKQGHSFERAAILNWISSTRHSCCPLTRLPMSYSDLRPNRRLFNKIEKWRELQLLLESHGHATSCTSELSVESTGKLSVSTSSISSSAMADLSIDHATRNTVTKCEASRHEMWLQFLSDPISSSSKSVTQTHSTLISQLPANSPGFLSSLVDLAELEYERIIGRGREMW